MGTTWRSTRKAARSAVATAEVEKGAPAKCDHPKELGIEEASGVRANYTLLDTGGLRFEGLTGVEINTSLLAKMDLYCKEK